MTVLLLAVLVVHAVTRESGPHLPTLFAALLMLVIYGVGVTPLVGTDRTRALVWLVLVVGSWWWLMWLAPEGVYLAFPLYFLAAHLLPDRLSVLAVAALAALAIGGYAAHEGLTFAGVLGPVLGALVAISSVLGLRAVQREAARRGVLEERERLAREVHDTLAQGLSSINLLLGAAVERLPDDAAHAPSAALVRQAREVAVANLEEARRFVHGLAPPALDGTELATAVQRAVDERPGTTLRIEGPVRPLPPSYDVALLRILREALTNARNHADADQVAVTLSYLDDEVVLDVVDNGHGFDTATPRSGYGLRSMQARAGELGGRLEVESTPGSGTAVVAVLPMDGVPTATTRERR